MMNTKEIITKLPYSPPFLFVDEIESVSQDQIRGNYTFKKSEYFYQGHFKEHPVTPGVILTECMAQIGLVSFGMYLNTEVRDATALQVALTNTSIDFLKPVFPGEKVIVVSEKIYFRFNKLKCKVKMLNSTAEVVCTGEISGMIISKE